MRKIIRDQIAGMNMNFQYFPFEYCLEVLERLGFSKIEIWAGTPHLYADDATLADAAQMKKRIAAHGMQVACYTPEGLFYPYNTASENEETRKRTIAFYKKNIDLAIEMESPYMLVLGGRGYYNQDTAEFWKRAVDTLAEVASYAEKRKFTLLLEPLQYEEANLVIHSKDVKKMLGEVGSPALKTMIDTVQMVSAGETIESVFSNVGEEIRHIHLTEGNPTGHLAPGDGTLPLGQFLRDLEELDYSYNVTLEIGPYLTEPEAAWKRGTAYIEKYL